LVYYQSLEHIVKRFTQLKDTKCDMKNLVLPEETLFLAAIRSVLSLDTAPLVFLNASQWKRSPVGPQLVADNSISYYSVVKKKLGNH
jgi:hypothetical protein